MVGAMEGVIGGAMEGVMVGVMGGSHGGGDASLQLCFFVEFKYLVYT